MQVKQQLEASYYDRFFEDNYALLKNLALRITGDNYEDSDDLLHDFYIKLTLGAPVRNPKDTNAYLFVALKNSYRSVIRKKRGKEEVLSFDEEFFSNTLFDEKSLQGLMLDEQLRAICKYACLRKDTSISGSVVVLRYFHGYYAGEVSRVIRRSRNAVEARLVAARREINQYLTNPSSVEFPLIKEYKRMEPGYLPSAGCDLLTELRRQIFSFCRGDCLPEEEYFHLYQGSKESPPRKVLSHLVSCPRCLNSVNRILKLPGLSTRHPLDSVRETMLALMPLFYLLLEGVSL